MFSLIVNFNRLSKVCIETYTRSSQTWTKTACRATLTQMMSSVCNDLEESLKKEMVNEISVAMSPCKILE